MIAAGTFFAAAPLLVGFLVFQRQFVSSFTLSGIEYGGLPCVGWIGCHCERGESNAIRDRIVAAILATTLLTGGAAQATEIDLFFPVQIT